jgi:two-component system cell cycle sensor histidine kinase/response regulator CckA
MMTQDQKLAVLVVDDDHEVAAATARVLSHDSYRVRSCHDGPRALELIAEERPDLLLLDRQLPGMDGLDICRQIKRTPELADMLVVMVSGVHTGGGEQLEGLDAGADGYITRPVGNQELLARVRAFSRIAQRTNDLRQRAEQIVARDAAGKTATDIAHPETLLHELQVHQVELELQNDELRRTQQEVQDARDRWARLFRYAPVGYVTLDENGAIVAANDTFVAMLSLDGFGLQSTPLANLVHADDRHVFLSRLRAFLKAPDGKVIELRLRSMEGHDVDAALRAARLDAGAAPAAIRGQVIVAVFDVSELRRAQHHLAASQRRQQAIVENLPMGMALVSPDLSLQETNPTLRRWFELSEDPATPLPNCEQLMPDCPAVRSFADRRVHDGHVTRTIGGKPRSLHVTSGPVFSADGKVEAAVLLLEDITEREALRQQVAQAQKMEAVGQLAGGLAHDLNNSLQAVLGNVELVANAMKAADPAREDLGEALAAGRRASELIKHLLAFSRRQMLQRRPVDLDEAIPETLKIVRRLLPETMALDWTAGEKHAVVLADTIHIEQVVLNICINARDAMPAGGRLRLSTEVVSLTRDEIVESEVEPGVFYRITIKDEGHGIPSEHLPSIFEPFFTTKAPGKGSGLGLSVAYGIVRQHGGLIEVDSTPGEDTTFTISLPVVAQTIAPRDASEASVAAGGMGERVLVVDDDQAVRQVIGQLLERAGYQVCLAADGQEALAILKEQAPEIRVVLSDLVMPNMGGFELYKEIEERYPELRFVAMSGYGAEAIAEGFPATVAVLDKPCSGAALRGALQKTLKDGPSPRS